ncbi:MAG: SRPBCC family protein [Pseudomonadota bacterium]|jgi:hypothetical protein|uniref:Polyketide cyclase/dehydrase n=1 Tax=hydrothermal vent metagenome TaxID=652676 RepID=A0A160TGP1_9ZZZZ
MIARAALASALMMAAAPAQASDYVVIRKEILVDRPADAVWKRVGGYCAIAEWLKLKCEIVSGSGDVGTIRRLNDTTVEPMVASTPHSYTYSQTAGGMAGFAYNGTLAVEPAGTGKSRIVYTLIYDAALMPSDEVRKAQFDRINPRFQGAVETMKALAEAKG